MAEQRWTTEDAYTCMKKKKKKKIEFNIIFHLLCPGSRQHVRNNEPRISANIVLDVCSSRNSTFSHYILYISIDKLSNCIHAYHFVRTISSCNVRALSLSSYLLCRTMPLRVLSYAQGAEQEFNIQIQYLI